MSLRRYTRSSGGWLPNSGSHLLAKRPLRLTYSWLKIGFALFIFNSRTPQQVEISVEEPVLSPCQSEVFEEEVIGVWAKRARSRVERTDDGPALLPRTLTSSGRGGAGGPPPFAASPPGHQLPPRGGWSPASLLLLSLPLNHFEVRLGAEQGGWAPLLTGGRVSG